MNAETEATNTNANAKKDDASASPLSFYAREIKSSLFSNDSSFSSSFSIRESSSSSSSISDYISSFPSTSFSSSSDSNDSSTKFLYCSLKNHYVYISFLLLVIL